MNYRTIIRLVTKALFLFTILSLLFAWISPLSALGRISAYNRIFPGRMRLPYGDNPERAYSISLSNLDAMFASHEIHAGPKLPEEYRVILIGDSSTWGFLLEPYETLSAQLNAAAHTLPDGRYLRTYNLGYPVMSLTKDLLILSKAVEYDADLIVWLVTLESFPYDKQLFSPLVQNNAESLRKLIRDYDLHLDPNHPDLAYPSFFDRTLIGERRALADLLRLQLYGVLWAATGIDHDLSQISTQRMEDLPDDNRFHELQPPLRRATLAFDVLHAGIQLADRIPVLIINEPIFVSQGENSDIRYNFFYPRWAYDQYRQLMADESARLEWKYVDYWNTIHASEFTNTAIHITPGGTGMFAEQVYKAISDIIIAP